MLNATEFVKHNEETEKAKLASLSQLLIDSEINKEIEKLIINDEKNKIQYITLNDLRHIKNRHNFTYTIDDILTAFLNQHETETHKYVFRQELTWIDIFSQTNLEDINPRINIWVIKKEN